MRVLCISPDFSRVCKSWRAGIVCLQLNYSLYYITVSYLLPNIEKSCHNLFHHHGVVREHFELIDNHSISLQTSQTDIVALGEAHDLYSVLNSKRRGLDRLKNKKILTALVGPLPARFIEGTFSESANFGKYNLWKDSVSALVNAKNSWRQHIIASHLLAFDTLYSEF